MGLESYALITADEWKDRFTAGGPQQGSNIEASCNAATLAIEARCGGRLFVSRGSITEYHTILDPLSSIYTGQWPIISVTTLHEDTVWPRAYAGTALVANTDYELVGPDRLRRLGSGGPTFWATGSRVVRLVYTAGYASTSAVPHDLKQVAFVIAASIFKESDRKQFGVSAATDATGSYQRFVGYFTPAIDEMLSSYVRRDFHRTWEVAA